jgi:uncharacterized SAM-binding protein YcdF (DUF218 family)
MKTRALPLFLSSAVSLLLGVGILALWGRSLLFGALLCFGLAALLALLGGSFQWASPAVGHRIRLGLVAILLLGVLAFGGLEGVVLLNARDHEPPQTPDAVLILGAALWDEAPSPVLQARLEKGADWLLAHPDVPVVVSGGVDTGALHSEAEVMAEYLIYAGVDASRILLEDQATNTLENLTYSMALLEQEGISTSSLLVVSSGPHLARARLLAARCGLTIGTLASRDPGGWVYNCYLYLREAAALVKSFLFDHP